MGAQSSNTTGRNTEEKTYSLDEGSRVLHAAVVVDSYSNPALMTADEKNFLRGGSGRVGNTDSIDRMPRNSIKAKLVSGGEGPQSTAAIFYPLFSHLSLPVKPGEQVWVIFEAGPGSQGFWITRITSDYNVDDPNYTHRDREYLYDFFQAGGSLVPPPSGVPSSTDPPAFNNGKIQKGGSVRTLPQKDEYNTYFDNAISRKEFVPEAVPRFTKASPSLALQGSNNTLITLGTETTDGVVSADTAGMGAIDIVTGRTAPGSILNERGFQEIDKNKYVDGAPNTVEGNQDFENDSARVFLTMSTGGDAKYGSTIDVIGGITSPTAEGSAAVVKADNARIVAKAGGNVTVVANGANIHIDSSGNVQIVTAGTISMGTSEDDLQPFVRGDDLYNAINDFQLALAGTTLATPAGPAPFSGATTTTGAGTLATACSNLETAVSNARSTVIKGE